MPKLQVLIGGKNEAFTPAKSSIETQLLSELRIAVYNEKTKEATKFFLQQAKSMCPEAFNPNSETYIAEKDENERISQFCMNGDVREFMSFLIDNPQYKEMVLAEFAAMKPILQNRPSNL